MPCYYLGKFSFESLQEVLLIIHYNIVTLLPSSMAGSLSMCMADMRSLLSCSPFQAILRVKMTTWNFLQAHIDGAKLVTHSPLCTSASGIEFPKAPNAYSQ